jgi:Flp pilus assembly protein TadG
MPANRNLPNREPRTPVSRGRSLSALRRDQEGVAAVEFALIALPFFALLFAILETALVFWSTQVLETAVANASRTIYTGQFQSANNQTSSNIGAKFKTELCKQVFVLFTCNSPAMRVDVRRYRSDTPPPDVIDKTTKKINEAAFGYEASGTGDIVLVRAAVEYPMFTPMLNSSLANLANGKRLIMGSAAFRNE